MCIGYGDIMSGKITSGLMSSLTDNWATPIEVFNELNKEFGFTLDVCASKDNHKCDRYFTVEDDGLKQVWDGVNWMNPPYGDVIPKWVKKAYETAKAGYTVVGLVPARTDTAWFQDYCMPAHEIRFIRGRLKFGGAKTSAPFPSAIIVWRPGERESLKVTSMVRP